LVRKKNKENNLPPSRHLRVKSGKGEREEKNNLFASTSRTSERRANMVLTWRLSGENGGML
jgi:hypothetical protein